MGTLVTIILAGLIFVYTGYVIYKKSKTVGTCNCDGCTKADCPSFEKLNDD